MNQFPPNLDPKIYNISSVVIGFALIQNFSAAEQNAIGNWFITVGQILENNSAWQQLIEQRMNGSYLNINSKQYKQTGNPKINDNDFTEFLTKDNIPKDITERLNKFLANIKKPQNIFNTFKKLK